MILRIISYLFTSLANWRFGAVGDHVTLLVTVTALVWEAAVRCLMALLREKGNEDIRVDFN